MRVDGERASSEAPDSGGHWRSVKRGVIVYALAMDPATPTTVYAATGQGLARSTDAGTSWTWLGPIGRSRVTALAIDPHRSATLYAGTWNGVFKSLNRGRTWRAANTGLRRRSISALVIDPQRTSTIYAGVTPVSPPELRACSEARTLRGQLGGLQRRTDQSQCWSSCDHLEWISALRWDDWRRLRLRTSPLTASPTTSRILRRPESALATRCRPDLLTGSFLAYSSPLFPAHVANVIPHWVRSKSVIFLTSASVIGASGVVFE